MKNSDAKFYRVAWLSIYGVPCYVRNMKFCKELLSDVGVLENCKYLEEKPARLDVIKLMIFTYIVGPINRTISVCVDGVWFKILIVEDISISMHKEEGSSSESYSSSEESNEGGDSLEYVSGGEEAVEREIFARG